MTITDLLAAADQAFSVGNYQQGLALLRKFNATDSSNAASFHRQAVVEEQVGDWSLAGQAHHRCIELAPHIAVSYLYAGCWLEQSGQIDAAAAVYSLAQEADPTSLAESVAGGKVAANSTDPTQLRAIAGNHLMRTYLSDQQRNLFTGEADKQRIQNAVWIQTHDAPISFPEKQFSPDLFYIPDLPEQAFYETDEFAWAKALKAATGTIKNELEKALSQRAGVKYLRPYLAKNANYGALQNLAGSLQWSALDLFKDGQSDQTIAALFPQTLNIIKSIPAYTLDQWPVEVFFSLLKPQQQISAHYGQSNHSLTAHLALEVPDNCYLDVAGEKRHWQEGELLIFNDSYLHSAHNPSEQLRIVLIFSVWHPALTEAEQDAIRYSFETRRNWMAERRSKLELLL